jgi:CheY-like chemotaxis protein
MTLTFKMGLKGHCHYHYNDGVVFEIYTYNNALEALSNFKPHFYDLILIDVYMPQMNGLELC